MKKLESLLKEIENKRKRWNEKSNFIIMKRKNLSQSDLDTLILYAKTQLRTGSVNGLMKQYGSVGEILKECGVTFEDNFF